MSKNSLPRSTILQKILVKNFHLKHNTLNASPAKTEYIRWLNESLMQRDPVFCTALLAFHFRPKLQATIGPVHREMIQDFITQNSAFFNPESRIPSLRYAGIGSRRTPQKELIVIRKIAHRLSLRGYTLLSGGAEGADQAFEAGCFGNKEIYLPWPGFRQLAGRSYIGLPNDAAFEIAEIIHPVWNKLNAKPQSLMARNSHQVLGADLQHPVDFILCWTPDGCESANARSQRTGGTGQAIALADYWGIPVINLRQGIDYSLQRIAAIIKSS